MNIVSNPPFAVKARQNHAPSSARVQPALSLVSQPAGAAACPEPENALCSVRTWRECQHSRQIMTFAEAIKLNPEDVDFQWDNINQRISFQPQKGPRRHYDGRMPRVGDDVGEPLLRALLLRVPRPVDGMCMASDRMLCHLVGNAFNQRAKEIRKALLESGGLPWFILTARGGYRWNPERSWRLIELHPVDSNQAG